MKTHLQNLFLLPALTAGFGLAFAGHLSAQTFTILYSFSATSGSGVNSDGHGPFGGLLLSGNTLYGTARYGGTLGAGTVYAINTDGTGFRTLHSFDGGSGGALPNAALALSSDTLYGTTCDCGGNGGANGTVFSVKTNGTSFRILHRFSANPYGTNKDGAYPTSALAISGNTVYGTAQEGGPFTNAGGYGNGTVFSLNLDGTGFKTIYAFTAVTNGALPYAGPIVSGDTLYGTANGGPFGGGTVFAVKTNGTGYTNLHSFSRSDCGPAAGLLLSGGMLYGTTSCTVFGVRTDGTGFRTLHTFTAISAGTDLTDTLILSGNTLYGTARQGGTGNFPTYNGAGTVFAVNTDGTGFTTLYMFSGGSDGALPSGSLALSENTLYGAALAGGDWGSGTIFSLSLPPPPPQLTISADGTGGYLIELYGTANVTYELQRAPSLTGPWDTFDTQTAPASGLIEFHDWFASPDRAFYRALQQ